MKWNAPLGLTIVMALLTLGTLGSVPLFDLDEGAFSQATQEMLSSGNYAATTLNGEPRYDKPIGIYWLQAASVTAFGVKEWAFRLPSALAALLWAFAFWRFLKPRLGAESASWGALMLLSALGTSVIAQAAIADAVLNLCISLALFDIYREFEASQRRYRLRVYSWLAFGFLVKGPVAVAIPVLSSGLFFMSSGRSRQWISALFEWRGWILFLALVTPWLIAVYQMQGWGFFVGFFGEHNLGRFTETREGHGGSVFYYLWALPLVLMPFAAYLVQALMNMRTSWRDPLQRFAWCWAVVVFVLVSLSATQLPHYVLYASPAFFLLMTVQFRHTRGSGLALIPMAWIILLSSLIGILPLIDTRSLRAYDGAILNLAASKIGFDEQLFASFAVAGAIALAYYARKHAQSALLGFALLHWLVAHILIVPLLAAAQQTPVQKAGLMAKNDGRPAVMYGLRMPSFSVYAGQPTPQRPPQAGEVALVHIDKTPAICEQQTCRTLFAEGGIRLLEVLASDQSDALPRTRPQVPEVSAHVRP